MQIETSISEDAYWKLRERAVANRRELDEELRQIIYDSLGIENESEEIDEGFAELVRKHFDLKKGKTTTENVVAVAEKMKKGLSYNEAVKQRAREYRESHPSITSNRYDGTVRAQCTRELGFTGGGATEKFKREVNNIIDRHGSR